MADHDDTDTRGRLLALEAENKRLWNAYDELMRDQTEIEKRLERLEKEQLLRGLKPPAKDSTE